MVKRYVFGSPIDTEAVIEDIPVSKEEITEINFKDNIITYKMNETTRVYGLGEANRGINKRGYQYVSYCTDEPSHTEEKRSLYGAHNFIVIDNVTDIDKEMDQSNETNYKECKEISTKTENKANEEKRSNNKISNKADKIGIFIDNPGKVTFDIGYEEINTIKIIPQYPDMNVYIITGENILEIVTRFRKMIGMSYIPPKWAFGFGQCRWSYENADRVNEVIKGYEENDMLISMVYLDIDYMEEYKDFTVNSDRFPNFKKYVENIKEKGIRLVPIIDAGVKIEDGYDIYEEGVKNHYFVKDEAGNDYITAVWPGYTHFPDFLNKEARKWFGEKYKILLDAGIEGFWNDMNEPAVFYSKNKVDEIKDILLETDIQNDEKTLLGEIRDRFNQLSNNEEDYSSMYHNIEGNRICHDKVHNLYGYHMSRAAGEAFNELVPDKKILLFSRASYIGMHRYSGIWMGDNCSWWSHILLNLKMLPSLNMCGFMYIGADVGGFGCDSTEDLVMRWMALGVFTPLFRNHSALGTRHQECYQFSRTKDFKNIIDVRYRLLPYIYEEYIRATEHYDMMYKPLAFVYPEDEIASNIEDELMLGDDVMIAPVYTQNAIGRYVYLPENMTFVKFTTDGRTVSEKLSKGTHFVKIGLSEVPMFIKENHKVKVVKQSVITDKALRRQIMSLTIEYHEEDYELIG